MWNLSSNDIQSTCYHWIQGNDKRHFEMKVCGRLKTGHATTQEALELFDSLEPLDVDFTIGTWQGEAFHTNHPTDSLL